MTQKGVVFKNNAPFRSCISKNNNIFIGNVEDLHIVLSTNHPQEYNESYSMTSGCLWNYYRDEEYNVNHDASDGKSFKYKTKISEKIETRPAQPLMLTKQHNH